MSTTLEILAPYLPYGIEVEVCRYKRGKLVALAMGQISMRVMADVVVPANGPDADLYSLSDTTPVLRSFADLCTPLADGTVPIKRVVELQKGLVCDPSRHIKFEDDAIWWRWSDDQKWKVLFVERYLHYQHDMTAHAADYLRRHHFAVPISQPQRRCWQEEHSIQCSLVPA